MGYIFAKMALAAAIFQILKNTVAAIPNWKNKARAAPVEVRCSARMIIVVFVLTTLNTLSVPLFMMIPIIWKWK